MQNTTLLTTENSALFLQTQQQIDSPDLILFLGMLLNDKTISFFCLFRFCLTMFPVPITLFKKNKPKKK